MLVTIHNLTTGTCAWCRQQTDDGVQAQFKDGLTGFFCKKDFWAALKARAAEPPSQSENRAPTKNNPQA